MNITVTHDQAGAMYFVPDAVTVPSSTSTISITMVPPSGAGWTITGVSSRPEATWSSNTAVLGVGEYAISVDASDPSKSGTSTLRIAIGVRDER